MGVTKMKKGDYTIELSFSERKGDHPVYVVIRNNHHKDDVLQDFDFGGSSVASVLRKVAAWIDQTS